MTLLEKTIRSIQPLDAAAMDAARARQDRLIKPPGSLGRLEAISVQVAGITGQERPAIGDKVVITCAGDHGVVAQGVSAFPQEVTPKMVANFLGGGAAINVLARQAGARVVVLDAGVAADLPTHPDLINAKVALGTNNFVKGPAMTRDQAVQAIEAGIAAGCAAGDSVCFSFGLAAGGKRRRPVAVRHGGQPARMDCRRAHPRCQGFGRCAAGGDQRLGSDPARTRV